MWFGWGREQGGPKAPSSSHRSACRRRNYRFLAALRAGRFLAVDLRAAAFFLAGRFFAVARFFAAFFAGRFFAVDLRAVDFLAVERFFAAFFAGRFFAVDLRAVVFRAVDFRAVAFFAVDFRAVDFLAVDFLAALRAAGADFLIADIVPPFR